MIINLILSNLLAIQIVLPMFLAVSLLFFKNAKMSCIFTIVYLFIIFLVSVVIFILVQFNDSQYLQYVFGNFYKTVGIEYKVNKISSFIVLILSFIALIGYYWGRYLLASEIGLRKILFFNILYLIFLTGMLGIVLTNDLFNIFIFTEISSIASYTLIGLNRTSKSSPVTAFNYLLIGSVASSLYVLGIGIIYGLTGSLNIYVVTEKLQLIQNNTSVIISLILITLFVLIKSGLFPFSVWVPKVYEDSPCTFNPIISGIASKIILFAFSKIIIVIFPSIIGTKIEAYKVFLNIIGVLSIIGGSVLALGQNNLKKMLAWSSVSYVGYIFLIIFNNNIDITTSVLLIIVWHSITKTGLFIVAGNIKYLFGNTYISNLGGFNKSHMFNFAAFIILGLSLVGFPGTFGFLVKLYLLNNLIHNGLLLDFCVIIISSVLSIFYVWKFVDAVLFVKNDNVISNKKLPFRMNAVLSIIVLLTILLGLFGNKFILFFYNATLTTFNNY